MEVEALRLQTNRAFDLSLQDPLEGFKSHRHRVTRTPDFHWSCSEVGGFLVGRNAGLGTFRAHFFDDATNSVDPNVIWRGLDRCSGRASIRLDEATI